MTFFKIVSTLLGGYFILVITAHFIFSKKFQPFFIETFLPEKKPGWIVPFAGVYTLFTFFTWWKLLEAGFFLASMTVTMVLSFGLLKMALYSMKYDLMRKAAIQLMTQEKTSMMILLSLGLAVGVLLLVAGLRM